MPSPWFFIQTSPLWTSKRHQLVHVFSSSPHETAAHEEDIDQVKGLEVEQAIGKVKYKGPKGLFWWMGVENHHTPNGSQLSTMKHLGILNWILTDEYNKLWLMNVDEFLGCYPIQYFRGVWMGLSSSLNWEPLYRLTNKYHGITEGFESCSHLLDALLQHHLKLVLADLAYNVLCHSAYWSVTQFRSLGEHSHISQSSWTRTALQIWDETHVPNLPGILGGCLCHWMSFESG